MKFSDYVFLCVYVCCSIPHGPPGTRRRGASRCQWLGRRRPPEPRSTDAPHRGPDLNALSGKSMISEIQWLKILWGCDDTWFSPQVGEKRLTILFDVLFPSKSKITTLCKPGGLRIFGNYKKKPAESDLTRIFCREKLLYPQIRLANEQPNRGLGITGASVVSGAACPLIAATYTGLAPLPTEFLAGPIRVIYSKFLSGFSKRRHRFYCTQRVKNLSAGFYSEILVSL